MAKKKAAPKKRDRDIPLSLYPLGFAEALADVMRVKPPQKPEKQKRKRPSR